MIYANIIRNCVYLYNFVANIYHFMAKVKKEWFCSSCGNESSKWLGRCPACGEWNTMKEEIVDRGDDIRRTGTINRNRERSKPFLLENIISSGEKRIILGNKEIDRVLGGGIVEGSLVLIGGEPGIGKSTLSLQISLFSKDLKTLYISGEESPGQIKLRADRLGGNSDNCYILCDTILENIITESETISPQLMIIDSIQTIYSEKLDSSPGSVSQVKECTAMLLRYAKESNIPIIIIGHITKEGSLAGPKVLEHIVDVVLQFEGESKYAYRILRSLKNRFGSTPELSIFEMTYTGLQQIDDPSGILTPTHEEGLSGTAVGAILDGTRPFMIEMQALVSSAAYGMPQRSATGFDTRRLNMLLAVLEKRAGFKLAAKDVFLNAAGGLRVVDPACDLAIVVSILSSNFDHPISSKSCFAAEVGLSGEIRPVNLIDRRVAEADRMGYDTIYISTYNKLEKSENKKSGIRIVKVSDIPSLCRALFK